MKKRVFLRTATILFGPCMFSSCAITEDETYKETVSSVLISAYGTKLVIMTERFHYIFDAPDVLVRVLTSNFHEYVVATFSTFSVDSRGRTKGTVTLTLVAAPDEARKAAIAAGFRDVGVGATSTVHLSGERYRAGNIQAPAEYRLNRAYEIEVRAEQPADKTAITPITVVGFALALVGVTLFAVTILIGCAVQGTLSSCHE